MTIARRHHEFSTVLPLLVMALALGCRPANSNAPPASESPADDAAAVAQGAVARDVAEVGLTPIDKAGYEQFLAEHRGRVVLVDFWATWCPPCMEGFPDSVRLSDKYGDQGLVVASVALEDLEDQPQVLEFLRQHEATFANFISAYGGSDARSMDEFELSSGTIPTLKLYDRQGNLRQTFGDGLPFTFEEIEVAIRALLLKQ